MILPSVLSSKSWTVVCSGSPCGPPLAASILEVAHEFFLLCVDGDYRLASALKGFCLTINVFELSVPVRMLLAFQHLRIRLEAVPHLMQKVGNFPVSDPVAPSL